MLHTSIKTLKELLASFKQFHTHYIFTTSYMWHKVSAGVGYWNYINGIQPNKPQRKLYLTKAVAPDKSNMKTGELHFIPPFVLTEEMTHLL